MAWSGEKAGDGIGAGATAFHVRGSVCAVFQYNLSTGDNIARFDNQKAAGLATGLDNSVIGKCCRGECSSCGGFGWSFAEFKGAIVEVEKRSRTGKPVEMYDLGTKKTIALFISKEAANLATDVDITGIGNCLNGRQQQAGGFGWRTPGSGEQEGIAAAATAASSRGNTKAKQDGPGNAIE